MSSLSFLIATALNSISDSSPVSISFSILSEASSFPFIWGSFLCFPVVCLCSVGGGRQNGLREWECILLYLKYLSFDFSVSSSVLASNLHICWDTIGCSLCSSDTGYVFYQCSGGSGLHSHLFHCHLTQAKLL